CARYARGTQQYCSGDACSRMDFW
nr:immunoglobulin heavy chain junction region [Macaca mulatta]